MVCIVGGGAAGMIAAIIAKRGGAQEVTLIERNEKLGKKLFLTGKGRCNLTNACDLEELFNNVPHNKKFLYSAIYGFDNSMTMDFFEELGLRLKVERGNRVFPVSDHSSDVIAVLAKELKRLKVNIMLNTMVEDICVENIDGARKITGVILKDGKILSADKVILATGGKSYKTTGSDGYIHEMLSRYDVKIKELVPSLVPFTCSDEYITSMQGLSLRNVDVTLKVGGKKRNNGFGEMLFTHFGVSGPLILSASAMLSSDDYSKDITLEVDLKPALSYDELDKRILRDFSENQNKTLENVLGKLLPGKMISAVIELTGIDSKKRVNSITKEERKSLIDIVKCFPIKVSGNRGFNEAIITRGGVDVKGINPSTMESKDIQNLYFAGEMIDVDAYTGGYNLQIAWSTGYLAGSNVL